MDRADDLLGEPIEMRHMDGNLLEEADLLNPESDIIRPTTSALFSTLGFNLQVDRYMRPHTTH